MFKVSQCKKPYDKYLFEEPDFPAAQRRAQRYSLMDTTEVLMIEDTDDTALVPLRLIRGGVSYWVAGVASVYKEDYND